MTKPNEEEQKAYATLDTPITAVHVMGELYSLPSDTPMQTARSEQEQDRHAPPAARDSKKPLETVSRGQLSSLRIGCGGSSRRASGCRPARSSATSSGDSASSMRAASSSRPCVAAVTNASAPCPGNNLCAPQPKPSRKIILLCAWFASF